MLEKNFRHINKDIHYFCMMRPVHPMIEISLHPDLIDDLAWFECEVVEDEHKVDDNYKITLKYVNGCSYESFYQDDFLTLIYEGLIIPKTSDDMHIEFINVDEPIPNSIAYIHHEGWCVVGTASPIKIGDTVRIKDFGFVTTVTNVDESIGMATVEWQFDGKTFDDSYEFNELFKVA